MGIERKLNIHEMVERFSFLGAKLPRVLFVAMLVSGKAMLASVSRKLRGEYLNVRTGHGWQSMGDFTRASGDKIQAGIDTDVGYMKAHEEGFHGTVQVRGHLRRIVSLQRNDRSGLVTKRSSTAFKRAIKARAARTAFVRPHTMKMNLRARRFMRDTVNQQVEPTAARIEKAMVIAASTGQIPTPGQLGA